MMTTTRLALLSLLPLTLAACDRQGLATDPVVIQTTQGSITCQLYDRQIVLWDEAVRFPSELAKPDADTLCADEGRRQRAGSRG